LPVTVSVPIELPGAMVALFAVRPATEPLPPRLPPLKVTPLARLPFTTSRP
jgi:hypothetical protein